MKNLTGLFAYAIKLVTIDPTRLSCNPMPYQPFIVSQVRKPLVRAALIASTALGFAGVASPAVAAGFYLQEQSTAALGSEFAGAGADARNASVMYYNPAAMTQLGGAQVNGNISVLKAWEDNRDRGSTITHPFTTGTTSTGGENSNDAIPVTPLPSLYAAAPLPVLDDRIWVGFGASIPFGLSTKYDDNWFGRFDSVKSELTVLDLEPTAAFKATDWLSIGGGVDIERAIARLTGDVTNGLTDGQSILKGDDWNVGYNLGALITPVNGTNIGFDYRSHVSHTLDGRVIVKGVPAAGPFPNLNENSAASATLDLPDIYGVSLAQQVAPKWKALAQVNYFHWSQFDNVTAVRNANDSVAESIAEDYRNTWSYAIGAEYQWRPDTTLRFGYQYDQTPTREPYRDTRVPDGNRNNFGIGASYDVSKNLTVDFAASYSLMQDSNVDVTRNGGLATVAANRGSTSFLFGSLGATYKF